MEACGYEQKINSNGDRHETQCPMLLHEGRKARREVSEWMLCLCGHGELGVKFIGMG